MSSRFAAFIAPLALLIGTGIASAQRHGGGHPGGHGGHPGGHVGAAHYGGAHYGGYGGHYGGYYGGYPYHHHHNNGWAIGVGIGLGYAFGGYPYGGYGYGYPYGGYGYGYPAYGYGYPAYDYGMYSPGIIMSPGVVAGYADPAAASVIPAAGVDPRPVATASREPGPATVTVIVPDDATVWFNGTESPKGQTTRVYTSPALDGDKTAVLTVKVERNGTPSQMRIPMRAGDKMRVDLRQ